MRLLLLAIIMITSSFVSKAQHILPLRDQARIINEITGERLEQVLPNLMKRENIQMWVLICREYNEDPVIKTMLPASWLSARRRTILVFYYNPTTGEYKKYAVARYNVGKHILSAWNPEEEPNQWKALTKIIEKHQPNHIAINYSTHYGHADGLSLTDYKELLEHLPKPLQSKLVSGEKLSVGWLESRTEKELQYYTQLVHITHQIIREGFSEQVIMPGITTTDDMVWWFREKIRGLGLETWFQPSVAVQRRDNSNQEQERSFANRPKEEVIQRGDLIHVDIGIQYLRLNTDIQQHAYLLLPGEKEPPTELQNAFRVSNRLQDILTQQFAVGVTGNQILRNALEQAKKEGITASIYSHPLGMHGHAAGPTIGLWDQQGGVPGSGDYPVYPNTAYSIELNTSSFLPSWKKQVRIMLEEDGFFDGKTFHYLGGRQKKLWTIPALSNELE